MVYLRDVVQSDMDILFEWANDPVVRMNSFRSDRIAYEEHLQWFKYIMEDENILLFIMMDDKTPVGQIRLKLEDESAEIGYSIASCFRGKGYGHRILQLVAQKIRMEYPQIKRLIAKVKPENKASRTLFEKEGYKMMYVYYCNDLQNKCSGGG